jgi:hypothetical protein
MIENYRTPPNHCLNCGKELDGAAPVSGGRGPQDGDISICLECHHVMIYDADVRVRALTDEEVVEIAGDPEVIYAMKVLGEFKQTERDKNAAQTPIDDRAPGRNRDAGDRGAGDRR